MIKVTLTAKNLVELEAKILELGNRFTSLGVTLTKSETDKLVASVKNSPVGQITKSETDDEPSVQTHSIKDVITALKDFAKAKGTSKAAELLGKYKVKNVHDLPESEYGKFINELR